MLNTARYVETCVYDIVIVYLPIRLCDIHKHIKLFDFLLSDVSLFSSEAVLRIWIASWAAEGLLRVSRGTMESLLRVS